MISPCVWCLKPWKKHRKTISDESLRPHKKGHVAGCGLACGSWGRGLARQVMREIVGRGKWRDLRFARSKVFWPTGLPMKPKYKAMVLWEKYGTVRYFKTDLTRKNLWCLRLPKDQPVNSSRRVWPNTVICCTAGRWKTRAEQLIR